MAFSIQVEGIAATVAMLQRAPKAIVATGFTRALDAAGQVIVRELWPRVPQDLREKVLRNRAHAGKGAMVANLDAFVELDSQFRGGSVDVGFGSLGHVALWTNYGHRIVGHKTAGLLGRKKKGKETGFVFGTRFMDRAAAAAAQAAVEAFRDSLRATLKSGSVPGVPTAA